MKEWMKHPEEFKEYTINYQGKEYSLLPEVFFALIIDEFKKKVEKNFILSITELTLPEELKSNTHFINRLKISLQSIGLKYFKIDDIEFDYSEQSKQMEEKNDVYVGLPAVLNKEGISKRVYLKLTDEEETKLQNSINVIKNNINSVDL